MNFRGGGSKRGQNKISACRKEEPQCLPSAAICPLPQGFEKGEKPPWQSAPIRFNFYPESLGQQGEGIGRKGYRRVSGH